MRRALRRARRTLVTGGVRSGKSQWAETALAGERRVTYVATAAAYPEDPEWRARVAAHRTRRPEHWVTEETADVAGVLGRATGAVLVDDLGNWLTRVFDEHGVWTDAAALPRAHARVDALVDAWAATGVRVVAVTNEVGSGIVPASASGRLFRDELGRLNARIAAACDAVVLLVCGIPQRLR